MSKVVIPKNSDGEAIYLGVLAYPSPSESQQRDKFVTAVRAARASAQVHQGALRRRDVPPEIRRFSRKKGALQMGFRRILKARVPAAWMALNVFLPEDSKTDPHTPRELSLNKAALALDALIPRATEYQHANLKTRVWRQSRPRYWMRVM